LVYGLVLWLSIESGPLILHLRHWRFEKRSRILWRITWSHVREPFGRCSCWLWSVCRSGCLTRSDRPTGWHRLVAVKHLRTFLIVWRLLLGLLLIGILGSVVTTARTLAPRTLTPRVLAIQTLTPQTLTLGSEVGFNLVSATGPGILWPIAHR
jgi:hypothetical protein